jgi:hypothetical protein
VYPNFLPLDLCHELLFIQRSLAVVGYRPNVQSLTLYELLLACPQLLPTVAKARQLIWDAVESQFDAHCQVWPETTSLISWTEGASIGWHHDANRWVQVWRSGLYRAVLAGWPIRMPSWCIAGCSCWAQCCMGKWHELTHRHTL